MFDNPKWTWATALTLRILRRPGNLAIVTNDELADQIKRSGGEAIVLHDLIEVYKDRSSEQLDDADLDRQLSNHSFVLVPLTYAYDEPLNELFEAARLTPEVKWAYTGKAPKEVREQAPDNIHFSGFVSKQDYMRLLSRALAVVAPTTSESTMQRAGYEALSASKPLMTTATRVLIDYFGDAAIAAPVTGVGFAQGIRTLLANQGDFTSRMTNLREAKLSDQETALQRLRSWCSSIDLTISERAH
ncbi:glycosyltransferase [Citricoccus sp. NPDC055426]|uniref:glycosyltransferase n=1 Tax=Citricoccus sp. NPDC055426 TaxID=3155536 RepID=UPI0034293A27